MSKRAGIFNTVRTEGAILPNELLQRIFAGDNTLEGLKPTDYHLSPSERLGEAATRSWNRLIGVWQTFSEIVDNLPQEAIGTTETRERWLLPLFQELGYGRLQAQKSIEIEGKSYPISHKASEPVAIHLVSFKWDLDKRNPIAKSETRLSPHSLIQEYLNRSDEHLWGILSNGHKLRILRNNVSLTRAAYVEFDLQAMMDGLAYSDFFLLYLLCHQSRVEVKTDETGKHLPLESSWLERWYNVSINDGVRALDELRNNVQSAIESLGAGFLSHPGNSALRDKLRSGALTLQEYYHQVLLQVYRLLFIFVAEDRDLLVPDDVPDQVKDNYLKYYSTYRIRELAGKRRGTRHSDLWYQFVLLFKSFYDGDARLGLPALGSFLFSDESTQDLADIEIANSDLLLAIRFLCYTQKNNVFQLINYRNLGSEELGSVYESLLEMHPEINLEAGYFKLNLVSGSERKTTGSYYTPSSLVNSLLDSALEPVMDNALKSAVDTQAKEQALLNLKICDPACGSGHFLISAAHRIAKRLASIRADEDEPAPSVIHNALREVIGKCIYGVDINPMAVELCKISLWMEALEPGKPLTFLDHHIQCGNSLLGCTPALLKRGIPDAAFTALTGDDRAYCTRFRKQNKEERDKGFLEIFSADEKPWEHLGNHSPYVINLNKMDDSDIDALRAKEAAYAKLMQSSTYLFTKFIYDTWCAAFVWEKTPSEHLPYPITQRLLENIEINPYSVNPVIRKEIMRIAEEYKFFHWHIAFPDVFIAKLPNEISDEEINGWTGGFDCVLGNPPWERVKLQEKEFFSARDADIAKAPNAAARKRLIKALPQNNPLLFKEFLEEKRVADASSLLIRESGRYPLCGRGDVNTYTVFAELNRILLSDMGRCGCIVPSGIATDDTTKFFFQDLMKTGSLTSFYEFENDGFFLGAGQGHMLRFALVTINGEKLKQIEADFMFRGHNIADLQDETKHFSLDMSSLSLINPNSKTCPIFLSKKDAELTKYIYHRVPVLINEDDPKTGNLWDVKLSTMFHMSSDSHLFRVKKQLLDMGFELYGNQFVKEEERYLPLYESKMIHLFDHRFGDFKVVDTGKRAHILPKQLIENYQNPNYSIMPFYWVPETSVKEVINNNKSKWMIGFRNVTDSRASARSVIAAAFPLSGVGNSLPMIKTGLSNLHFPEIILANLGSIILDYCARFKIGGLNLNFFIVKQLPILPPDAYSSEGFNVTDMIRNRCLELTYTAWDMKSFAMDCGYDGSPFIWDEERRFEIRCELDAIYFHLYLGNQSEWESQGSPELLSYLPTPRCAIEYIMDTFPIVKDSDEKEFGEYRTKRRILDIYDQMIHCLATNTEYRSTLDPPPGPPSDAEGNFIPVENWDENNWPSHIHFNLPKNPRTHV